MALIISLSSIGINVMDTNAGSVYYDGTQFKHYGCNSTDWVALY